MEHGNQEPGGGGSVPVRSGWEGQRRYEQIGGIHLLRLDGNDYDLGFQHGKLLGEVITQGSLPYFAGFMDRFVGGAIPGPIGRWLARGLAAMGTRRMGPRYPRSVRDQMQGMADGSGLSRKLILQAFTMPETYLWFISTYSRFLGRLPAPRLGVPLLGCSSVAVWDEASADGTFLHGRNLDYHGVGVWDRDQAVLFHAPRGGQRFVSVASAGVMLGGITAMNEAGLTLALHQHLSTKGVTLSGLGVGVVGDRIMRYATTLDEARRILDRHRPSAAFTYLIGSGSERALLCYEVTPRLRSSFRVDGNSFGYTNIFLTPKLARQEMHFYPSQWRWNTGRYHCIEKRLESIGRPLEPNDIASILGDPGDSGCRLSRATGMLLTVGSVVFQPEHGLVYVGTGRAPTSTRPYIAFDLTRGVFRPDRAPLTGGVPQDERERKGFDAYRDAFEAYSIGRDLVAAGEHLERAIQFQPKEALYHFAAGLVRLLAGDPVAARLAFERALQLGHSDPERVSAFYLWRGRCRDLEGNRNGALADYRRAESGDVPVASAAFRGLRRPWRRRFFSIDFAFADVVLP